MDEGGGGRRGGGVWVNRKGLDGWSEGRVWVDESEFG